LRGDFSPGVNFEGHTMTESEYNRKQDELDRLLNDPGTPMRPDRIWSLLEDLARETSAFMSSARHSAIQALHARERARITQR
jgi:hypothetical protein